MKRALLILLLTGASAAPSRAVADIRSTRSLLLHELRMTANGLGSAGQVGLLTSLSPEDFSGEGFDRRELKDSLRQAKFDPTIEPGAAEYKTPMTDEAWFQRFAPKLGARIEGLQSDEDVADFLTRLNGWIEENGKHYIDEQDGTNYIRPLLDAARRVKQQLPEHLAERVGQTATLLGGDAHAAQSAPAADSLSERAPNEARADVVTASAASQAPAPTPVGLAAAGSDLKDAPAESRVQLSAQDRALQDAWSVIVRQAHEEELQNRLRRAKYGPTFRESLAEWAERSPWGQPFFYDPDTGRSAFHPAIRSSKNAIAAVAVFSRQSADRLAQRIQRLFVRGEKDSKDARPSLFSRLGQIDARKIWNAIAERRRMAKEEKARLKSERGPSLWAQIWNEKSLRPIAQVFRAARAARAEARQKKREQPSLWRQVWRAKSLRPALDRFKAWLLSDTRQEEDSDPTSFDATLTPAKNVVPITLSRRQQLTRQARRVALTMSDIASAMGENRRAIELRHIGDAIAVARFDPLLPNGALMLEIETASGKVRLTLTRASSDLAGRDARRLEIRPGDSRAPSSEFWIASGAGSRWIGDPNVDELDSAELDLKLAEEASGWLFMWHAQAPSSRAFAAVSAAR